MTDPKVDIFEMVQKSAIFFRRDTEENLPSGDEVRQLMEKGTRWRYLLAGYLRGPKGDTISAFASTNELKPAEDWEEKAYRGLVVHLVNGFMQQVIEMQAEAEAEKQKVVTP